MGKSDEIGKLNGDGKTFEVVSNHGDGARFVSDFWSWERGIFVKNLHRCFKVREQQNLNLHGNYKVSKGSFLSSTNYHKVHVSRGALCYTLSKYWEVPIGRCPMFNMRELIVQL